MSAPTNKVHDRVVALMVVNRRLREAQKRLVGLRSVPWSTRLAALRAERQLAENCRDRIVYEPGGQFAEYLARPRWQT